MSTGRKKSRGVRSYGVLKLLPLAVHCPCAGGLRRDPATQIDQSLGREFALRLHVTFDGLKTMANDSIIDMPNYPIFSSSNV
jgi:hypothetical protein